MFSIFKNEIAVNLFSASITLFLGILTLIITRTSNRSATARERLDKVYHPLFMSAEPLLYRPVSFNDLRSFILFYRKLESDYSLLISPTLRCAMYSLCNSSNPCPDNSGTDNPWYYVCKVISREYDHLCRMSYLPVRSVSYRYNRAQYSSRVSLFFAFLWIQLPAIIFFGIMLGALCPMILPIPLLFFLFLLIRTIADEL